MSDGPHKSLPLSRAWRELSKRADQRTYGSDDVVQAVEPALRNDWKSEDCDQMVARIRDTLGDDRQRGLFPGQAVADLETLRRETAGRPMARRLLDGAIDAIAQGLDGAAALEAGASAALKERGIRGIRSCEEHWTRSESDKRTSNMRQRLENAMSRSDYQMMGRQFLSAGKLEPGASLPAKRTALDDGVSLR